MLHCLLLSSLLLCSSQLVDDVAAEYHLEQAHWGLSVRDVETGEELVAYNPQKLFAAASVTKLYTSAKVLEELGPDFHFTTSVLQDGEDLVLRGGGDPSLTSEDLQTLAEKVRAAGVVSVRNLILDESGFYCPQYMDGAEVSDLPWYYAVEMSALNVDENVVGKIAIRDPASYAGAIFERALGDAGIAVRGTTRKGVRQGIEIASHASLPLAALITRCNKESKNLYAEVFAAAVDMDDLPVRGSGMSRRMLLAPDQLTKFLLEKQDCKELFDSLPIAGVDGTLGGRFTESPYRGKIFAKTGSLSCVRNLAGYAYTREGRLVAFAIMANGLPDEGRPAIDALLERVLDSI